MLFKPISAKFNKTLGVYHACRFTPTHKFYCAKSGMNLITGVEIDCFMGNRYIIGEVMIEAERLKLEGLI